MLKIFPLVNDNFKIHIIRGNETVTIDTFDENIAKMCIRDRARDGHVFPVPSNGSCNKILKDIGSQCGFKVRLTYHVARHTNATLSLIHI